MRIGYVHPLGISPSPHTPPGPPRSSYSFPTEAVAVLAPTSARAPRDIKRLISGGYCHALMSCDPLLPIPPSKRPRVVWRSPGAQLVFFSRWTGTFPCLGRVPQAGPSMPQAGLARSSAALTASIVWPAGVQADDGDGRSLSGEGDLCCLQVPT